MRLDRYLHLAGFGTRSDASALIRAGRVTVDGVAERDAGRAVDDARARVEVDGVPARVRTALHLMLNKPAGVLTAARDPHRQTVLDLLPPLCRTLDCMPVGRLDLDTEGLLLLTTDGTLAHRLLSPKRGVDKVYFAEVDMPLNDADVRAFAEGIRLSDFTTLPAVLEILPGGLSARVTVREGKFHQVKRMFSACGKQVLRLKRLSFGGVRLDEALVPGQWRELTGDEVARLRDAAGQSKGPRG